MLEKIREFYFDFFVATLSLYKSKLHNWSNFCSEQDLVEGFIQAILMSGRRHKILNLLIEFSNSIFIKIYFKAYWRWTCIQNKLPYKVYSMLSYLFALQTKIFFKGFTPLNPHQGPAINLLRSLQHFESLTCILQHSKTQSLFKNGHK